MNDKLWSEFVLTCRKLLEIWQREYQQSGNKELAQTRVLWLKDKAERVQDFINDKDYAKNLRRNAAKSYHPDILPKHLKKSGEDIMKDINRICDDIEKDK